MYLIVILTSLQFFIFGVYADQASVLMSKFHQNKFLVRQERLEVVRFDKTIISKFEARTFKHNRTQAVYNVTFQFNIDPENGLTVKTQAYKFMSNEYRFFPIELELPFCVMFNENLLGMGHYKCGNFTGCPLRKRTIYHVCNWVFDGSRAPPLIPDGRYMLESQVKYHNHEVAVVRGYGEVTTPFMFN